MPPETWQGAEPSRSAVKRWQRWRQRRRRARNLPPRPQPPGDAAEPPEKVCKLPAGAARTPGHLAGGQAGARGLTPSRVLGLLLPPLPQGCPRSWWARPGRGRCSWRALGFCSRRGRLKSGEALLAFTPPAASCLPPSRARWHHYLFSAAAPNDSCCFAAAARWQFLAAEPLRLILQGTA